MDIDSTMNTTTETRQNGIDSIQDERALEKPMILKPSNTPKTTTTEPSPTLRKNVTTPTPTKTTKDLKKPKAVMRRSN
jgi:hypothetical protein